MPFFSQSQKSTNQNTTYKIIYKYYSKTYLNSFFQADLTINTRFIMITSDLALKGYLEKAIDDLIVSLNRRILINVNTTFSLNKTSRTYFKESHLTVVESPNRDDKDVQQIISECYETINKLILLRFGINSVEINLLMHLFANYSRYSFNEILAVFNSSQDNNFSYVEKTQASVA